MQSVAAAVSDFLVALAALPARTRTNLRRKRGFHHQGFDVANDVNFVGSPRVWPLVGLALQPWSEDLILVAKFLSPRCHLFATLLRAEAERRSTHRQRDLR